MSRVTTPQELDERFRAAVAALSPGDQSAPPAADPAGGGSSAGGPTVGGSAVPGPAVSGPAVSGPAVSGPAGGPGEPVRPGSALTGEQALKIFQAQLTSRHLDLAARWLRGFGEGFYTTASAGHEGNAAVALAVRPTDPALLHYRSGAYYAARASQAGHADAVRDVLRGLAAATTDPIAGGRHKVFGHPALAVIPVASTIAAHLPRAVGLAYAIEHGRVTRPRLVNPVEAPRWPDDAIVICSFGDAAINHATARAAFNTAGWFDHQGEKVPVLLVCEDNRLGVSARSPAGWARASLESLPGIRYLAADGCDPVAVYDAAVTAAEWVRTERRPAVLHLDVVRYLGHTGADAETAYRTRAEIEADLARDPLVATAALLVAQGLVTPDEVLARYDQVGWEVRRVAEEVIGEPKLSSATEVVAPLAPRRPVRVARAVADAADLALGPGQAARLEAFGGRLPEKAGPLTLAQTINATLTDALLTSPATVVFGADVATKGGLHGVTTGLRERFGSRRVFDTLRDETSILGLALGAGLSGLVPVPEIQYLAYLHSGEDQLRGEAAALQFFSSAAYRNPMVIRVPGLAYQEGIGGQFAELAERTAEPYHNDNSVAVLRDIPGLVVAVPSGAAEAAPMLRTCLAAAAVDGSVCVFLEPIALYHTRDLHSPDDNGWLAPYAPPTEWARDHVTIGRARVYGEGEHLTVITFGNGVRMSLRVAARLAERGVGVRVVDLRWLNPLPTADLVREAGSTGRVLIVDETRRSGGVGEGVLAALVDAGYVGAVRRVFAANTFVPIGDAARHVLVSEQMIEEAAATLLGA
jgi:2-oxoisovalerate dehydrogenase E1 component